LNRQVFYEIIASLVIVSACL